MVEVILRDTSGKPSGYFPEDYQGLVSDPVRLRITMRPHVWRPPTDVYETEDMVVIRVEIAGMRSGDFSISLENRSLLIRGVRSDIPERRAYHQMEIPFGEFSTDVDLPAPVSSEGIDATYNDGFLRIVLQKARAQQIQIEDGNR